MPDVDKGQGLLLQFGSLQSGRDNGLQTGRYHTRFGQGDYVFQIYYQPKVGLPFRGGAFAEEQRSQNGLHKTYEIEVRFALVGQTQEAILNE